VISSRDPSQSESGAYQRKTLTAYRAARRARNIINRGSALASSAMLTNETAGRGEIKLAARSGSQRSNGALHQQRAA